MNPFLKMTAEGCDGRDLKLGFQNLLGAAKMVMDEG